MNDFCFRIKFTLASCEIIASVYCVRILQLRKMNVYGFLVIGPSKEYVQSDPFPDQPVFLGQRTGPVRNRAFVPVRLAWKPITDTGSFHQDAAAALYGRSNFVADSVQLLALCYDTDGTLHSAYRDSLSNNFFVQFLCKAAEG